MSFIIIITYNKLLVKETSKKELKKVRIWKIKC